MSMGKTGLEVNERRTILNSVTDKFGENLIKEMIDLLMNPTRDAVNFLVWVPDRLKT